MIRVEPAIAGESALAAGRWLEARASFEAALTERETPEARMGLGQALWWLGDVQRSIECHERAYVSFRRAGDAEKAAWAALWTGLTYGSDLGNVAAFNGWRARAERLLRGVPVGAIHGWLHLVQAFDLSDLRQSRELTEDVLDLAREFGDCDLELCALAHLGYVLVAMAQPEEGFALIDEAMAATFGGERRRFDTVVFTCCGMIAACVLEADIERARQWCNVADDFIQTYGCPFHYAQCRTGYGGVLFATGQWIEAERQLLAAVQATRAT